MSKMTGIIGQMRRKLVSAGKRIKDAVIDRPFVVDENVAYLGHGDKPTVNLKWEILRSTSNKQKTHKPCLKPTSRILNQQCQPEEVAHEGRPVHEMNEDDRREVTFSDPKEPQSRTNVELSTVVEISRYPSKYDDRSTKDTVTGKKMTVTRPMSNEGDQHHIDHVNQAVDNSIRVVNDSAKDNAIHVTIESSNMTKHESVAYTGVQVTDVEEERENATVQKEKQQTSDTLCTVQKLDRSQGLPTEEFVSKGRESIRTGNEEETQKLLEPAAKIPKEKIFEDENWNPFRTQVTSAQGVSQLPMLCSSNENQVVGRMLRNNFRASRKKKDEEIKRLKRRCEETEDQLKCKVCLEAQVSDMLVPCGHLFCDSCIEELNRNNPRRCPLCRTEYNQSRKAYL